jgi:hypothetical protein
MSYIVPLAVHKRYGVLDLPVRLLGISKSNRANKKYAIRVLYGGIEKTVHFGDSRYGQYHDRTPMRLYAGADHGSVARRESYLRRATAIRDRDGSLVVNDPFSPNRYAVIVLW